MLRWSRTVECSAGCRVHGQVTNQWNPGQFGRIVSNLAGAAAIAVTAVEYSALDQLPRRRIVATQEKN